jgi:hypothetical protein
LNHCVMNKNLSSSICIVLLICLTICTSKGQSTNFEPGSPVYPFLERMEMKSGTLYNGLFLDMQPVQRNQVDRNIFFMQDSAKLKLTRADRYWMNYLNDENLPHTNGLWNSSRKPFLKYFYESKANLYQFQSRDSNFQVFINPVLAFGYGKEKDSAQYRYRNTRGVEIRGIIDKHIGFYTYITDNQVLLPGYVQNRTKHDSVIPGEGYFKLFKNGGYDYFTARGYFTFSPEKHIHFQFGNTQNFIGSGYRSLLLSDYAKDYLNLVITTRVWRFQYQNIFAQMTDNKFGTLPYPAKYAAFHYLSFDAAKFLNIGVFEGVMFYDILKNGRGFDFSYLNPVIFYRSVEQNSGSPDNALAGANINILPCRNFKIYGQLLFDEFEIHQLVSNKGWWGNKYATQLGIKWIDVFGLPNVDWQSEFNLVRPYTYSEKSSSENYSTYGQALAHPLGANLSEFINIIRINPTGPLDIKLKYIFIAQGQDSTGSKNDYGSNIFTSYAMRTGDYGVQLLQGLATKIQIAEIIISYQVRHNLFVDVNALYRSEANAQHGMSTIYAGIGLRLNFMAKSYDF